MKLFIIVALCAAVATAENVGAAEQNQRLLHIIGGIIGGLLTPRPIVPGPAIVDKPAENPIWVGPVIIDSPAGEGPVIGNPIWAGPAIIDGPAAGGPVIAEYPEIDSPISVSPVIIDEPADTDAPILIPQPVFPFPITSPLVQVIVNVD